MKAVLLLTLLLSGCATNRIGDFTVLSSRMFNPSGLTEDKLKTGKRVQGESVHFASIPNLKSAIDDALDKGNGDVLVDAVVYHKIMPFAQGYVVEGRVINSRQ
jgi:hypothetical protein